MSYSTVEKTNNGFLVNTDDWNEDMAVEIAAEEGISELTERHWDLINYLRDEYLNNNANQPSERHMLKAMGEAWGGRPKSSDLYDLFPKQPSKQATRIAGLPETLRKGGY